MKEKKLKLLTAIMGAAALLTHSCNKPEVTSLAELEITTESPLEVSATGGIATFSYEITNPADNGAISAFADSDCDWISGINTEQANIVAFDVDRNPSEESRRATITLTYTLGNQTIEDSIELIQKGNGINDDDPEEPEVFDYEFTASVFAGEYCGTYMTEKGKHAYVTQLSNNQDVSQPETTTYLFGMICSEPEDGRYPYPTTGLYNLYNDGYEDMTFFSAKYIFVNGNGDIESELDIIDGVVEFRKDGDAYVFEAKFTDSEGKRHHVTYSSKVSLVYNFNAQNTNTLALTYDVRFAANSASARYEKLEEGRLAEVSLTFAEDGYEVYNSDMNVTVYFPFDESNGELMTGTYTVSNEIGAFTIKPGYWLEYNGVQLAGKGTYLDFVYDGGRIAVGIVTSGTMTVSGKKGAYDITFDFLTEDGYSLKGTYKGDVNIDRFGLSTLSGDREVDLSGATATIENKYDLDVYYDSRQYESGWELNIATENGDRVRFQLASEIMSFHEGIPAGTYSQQISSSCDINEFVKGFRKDGDFKGSFFFSDFDDNGIPQEFAPATKGTLEINKVSYFGEYLYTISFEIEDDMGNIWSGSWQGEVENLAIQNVISTLKSDREVIFENPTATAKWYGNNRRGEMLWEIVIKSENSGDCVRFNLCTSGENGFEGGVPSTQYTYSLDNDDPWRPEFLTGIVTESGELKNTFFFSDFDSNGKPKEYAPAVKGRKNGGIELTNNGDGTYYIYFKVWDDCQNWWYGEFSGAIEHIEADEKITVGY